MSRSNIKKDNTRNLINDNHTQNRAETVESLALGNDNCIYMDSLGKS